MTVYLDIVLIENILMNYIILFATGFIQRIQMKQTRILISSIFGGIYAILTYLSIIPIYSSFFMKILLSIIMIYIAFNPQNEKYMLILLDFFCYGRMRISITLYSRSYRYSIQKWCTCRDISNENNYNSRNCWIYNNTNCF